MKKTLIVFGLIGALIASTCVCGINHAHAGTLTTTAGVGIATAELEGAVTSEDDNNLELFASANYGFGRYVGVQGRVGYANLDFDDTVNITTGLVFRVPTRISPYLVIGGGWQNTGFATDGAKQIGTAALGVAADAGPVGLSVEYRVNAFNEDITGGTIDAKNGSVNVGFRVKAFN